MEPSPWKAALARFHLSEWGAELAGTAILMIGGLSAVALDFGRGSPVAAAIPAVSPRLLLTGALFAATGSLLALSPLGGRLRPLTAKLFHDPRYPTIFRAARPMAMGPATA